MKKTYLLTGIESGLMKDFKTACSHYGMSMRETLIKHMKNIVSDYMADLKFHHMPINNTKK